MRAALPLLALIPLLFLAGCSSAPAPAAKEAAPLPSLPGPATTTSKHPWAKFIELSGFRLSEAGPGKLQIKLVAVNHSEADLSEMTMRIRLITSVAKPGDPPIAEFEAKIPALGPLEVRDVTLSVASKLRAYEFPDWQFLRAEFDILAPEP
jgi:hypothetical protein